MRLLALLLLPLLMAFEAPLEDAKAEARAVALMEEIRCVACENEPISQSSADIAVNMRIKVRELVGKGASDDEVRAWFAQRYGEFVLFRPTTTGTSGLILWGLPFGLLFIGACTLFLLYRKPEAGAELEAVAPDAFDYQDVDLQDTEAAAESGADSVIDEDPEPDHEENTQK